MSSVATVQVKDEEEAIKRGIRELLASLPQDELAGLLKTVTSSLVQFGSVPRDENGKPKMDATTHAINSILLYGDAISLLNRSRMKKAYLAEYLNQKGVPMTMPPTKNSLCRDVLNYWGQQIPDHLRLIEDEGPRNQLPNSRSDAPVQNGNAQNMDGSQHNYLNGQALALGIHQQASHAADVHNNELSRIEHENAVSLRQKEAELGLQLGREFAAWYYERLNTLTDFTAAHFWGECNFRLEIIFATEPDNAVIDEIMMNGEATCAKIKDLVAVKNLYFNPHQNVSGIRGYLNPHGLAQVMVCGTLHHRDSGLVGVFEQMFGLVKDPRFGNNFKIKFSVLRLREGQHLALPTSTPELVDSSLVGIVEEIDDD